MDSQPTLTRIQSDTPGPEQLITSRMRNWQDALTSRNIQVKYWCVPTHEGIEGNEAVAQQATKAAYKHGGSYTKT